MFLVLGGRVWAPVGYLRSAKSRLAIGIQRTLGSKESVPERLVILRKRQERDRRRQQRKRNGQLLSILEGEQDFKVAC